MISFFPDVNVWLALSVQGHPHAADSWGWLNQVESPLIFSRYTQLGLLRLLTNQSVMGADRVITLGDAWDVYDSWLGDSRVELQAEPRGMDSVLREITRPFDAAPATKWVGDCYVLAFASGCEATLVTFDRPLIALAHQQGCAAIQPRG